MLFPEPLITLCDGGGLAVQLAVRRQHTHKELGLLRAGVCAEVLRHVGDVVLDPFNGSGSTCVAAKTTGRTYVGVDLSTAYCEIAEQRVQSAEAWVAPEVQV